MAKTLKTYRKRRGLDKARSAEPYGRVKKTASGNLLFVIQKHDASHLHYDFRLEIDGVLVGGASLDPKTFAKIAQHCEKKK